MPMTRRAGPAEVLLEVGEARDHAGVRRSGDRAHHDRVEEHAELALLRGDLVRPVREAEAAEPVVGCAGRDRVRRAARLLDVRDRLPPRLLEPDAEPGRRESHVGAHEPRQQDVADPVVHGIRPVDPVLLHEHGLHAEVRGDGGDLPGVVGLHAADRDERVGALGERVGHEVLELAGLVAAEGEAAVHVLALHPDAGAAEVGAQPVDRMDRARPERQLVAGEIGEGHGAPQVGVADAVRGACASVSARRHRRGQEATEGRPVVVGGGAGLVGPAGGAELDDALVVGDGRAAGERAEPGAFEATEQRRDLLEQPGQQGVRARTHGDAWKSSSAAIAASSRRGRAPRRSGRWRRASRRGPLGELGHGVAHGQLVQRGGDALGGECRAGVERRDDGLLRAAGLHEPGRLEPGDRLADGRAADAEPLLELRVAQALAGGEFAAHDRVAQLGVGVVAQRPRALGGTGRDSGMQYIAVSEVQHVKSAPRRRSTGGRAAASARSWSHHPA